MGANSGTGCSGRHGSSRVARPGVVLLLLVLPVAASAAAALSVPETRGRTIYTEGRGRDPIRAWLPGPRIEAKGKDFPCVKCHGEAGKGVLEGGVRSADITWFNLTKAYRGTRASGRTHPAYTDETLKRAVTAAVDPAGNVLHEAHPRYRMSKADLDDLAAFLKVLGSEPVPGVGDNEVRIGILFPRAGPLAAAAADVRALLAAYFKEFNGRGGLFGRIFVLVPFGFDPDQPGSAAAEAKKIAVGGDIFCLVSDVGLSSEDDASKILSGAGVPAIAPFLVGAESRYGEDRFTFYVYPTFFDEGRVLADFAVDNLAAGNGGAAIVYADDRPGRGGAAGVREQAGRRALRVVAEEAYAPGAFDAAAVAGRLGTRKPGVVFFFGGGQDASAFLAEAGRARAVPVFLAPAAMVGSALLAQPPEIARMVYLSAPRGEPDPGAKGFAEFFRILDHYDISRRHGAALATAFAGALVIEEGVRLAGRALTRSAFVNGLSTLRGFRTGVTPPLTFDENRRVGARGAAILAVDPAQRRLVPFATWREPRQ